jgi:membrane-associated phospholipid phosphatase
MPCPDNGGPPEGISEDDKETIVNASTTRHTRPFTDALTRRAAVRGLGGAGVAALGLAAPRRAIAADAPPQTMIEPGAGTWQTWLLTSGDELRPEAPPDAATTEDELTKLLDIAADRDGAALDRVSYWDAGSPGYRWNEIATGETVRAALGPASYRVMALLNAAIYDATIATWDAKYAFDRPRPAVAAPELTTVIPTPSSPSYPDEHAATAGAAATVLSALFPEGAESFAAMAEEAADSRVAAGVAYPSDVAAGLALGQVVGERFAARAASDNFDAEFDPATMPEGPGIWTGEPFFPMMGTWQTWVLTSGDQFRPGPPPAPASPERAAEIAEVKEYQRDTAPFTELFFWPQDPAGRPEPDTAPFTSTQAVYYWAPVLHLLWGPELAQKLFEYRWDVNPPRAARAYALVSVAGYDATVACWDAKYVYWTARPYQFDSEITPVLPQYGIPDYPSGHATTLGATAEVLSYLFPRDERFFQSRAEENAASRVWAGIHFRSAVDAGLQLGRDVGDAVIAWAEGDGSN